ncbi:alpha-E domain-containing protein [Hymenobacter cellulosilyticus]|uniref:Alpha-E domain-containing protein n=1 Tax=Hymenobacter cellulosilyticus TaxID=2932248 RepID=A0A8T9Q1C3_9BACT|nr:alpha-E domain-containing protein [Hymenobacter cellulosilyticus]UOQ71197.1 alpha-E domain-containing protein [Hymenobacter cellulosilyticus]
MLSRVADTIYWLARYMERTQAMLQVIRTHYQASQDSLQDFSWRPLLYSYGDLSLDDIAAAERDTTRVLDHLILDRENGASVYNNVYQARENARAAQDHIAREVWQCLNDFYHTMRDAEVAQQLRHGDPLSAIDGLMRNCLVFAGAIKSAMPRDESYSYLALGKLLERALQTTDTLRVKWAGVATELQYAPEAPELRYLLHALFGHDLYLKTYRGHFKPDSVLQFVLHNCTYTHSLIACLNQLSRYFEQLQPNSLPESYEKLNFLIGRLANLVKYRHVEAANPETLNEFLLETRQELLGIAGAFGKYYFGRS